MERFRVVGGVSLRGEVSVVGAKNSALKLMAGALLAVGKTRLTNVPAILDVTIMAEPASWISTSRTKSCTRPTTSWFGR